MINRFFQISKGVRRSFFVPKAVATRRRFFCEEIKSSPEKEITLSTSIDIPDENLVKLEDYLNKAFALISCNPRFYRKQVEGYLERAKVLDVSKGFSQHISCAEKNLNLSAEKQLCLHAFKP